MGAHRQAIVRRLWLSLVVSIAKCLLSPGWLKNTLYYGSYPSPTASVCSSSGVPALTSTWSLCVGTNLTARISQITTAALWPFSDVKYAWQDVCRAAVSLQYAMPSPLPASCPAQAHIYPAPGPQVWLRCPAVRGQPPTITQAFDRPPPYGAVVSLQNARLRGQYLRVCSAILYTVRSFACLHQRFSAP
jgi:hypothetical protein